MTNTLTHRGPDLGAHWVSADSSLALGHRRLAIVDLSSAGNQPMQSASGRFTIIFNGEIYNHADLRQALERSGESPTWRGHSDTETLLAAVERWGLQEALRRCEGMFAFGLWDARDRRLHLARDRFGEKPLYYGWAGGAFLFASELKAFVAHPAFSRDISTNALGAYLRFAYVPTPHSIFRNAYKLEPGCLMTLSGHAPGTRPEVPLVAPATYESCTVSRWWSLAKAVREGGDAKLQDETAAVHLLEEHLSNAVRGQMIADVPIGAFLSGGVDSSLIVALMQRQSARRVQTFTIGFGESEYDESAEAQRVATHLGTEHHVLNLSPRDALDVVPALPAMYDEPFADSSQIPTHLVCRAARSRVTVSLSGDGGDELFGGYNRYLWAPRIWGHVGWLPYAGRLALQAGLSTIAAVGERSRTAQRSIRRPAEKIRKLASAMHGAHSLEDLYGNLISSWRNPEDIMQHAPEAAERSYRVGAAPLQGTEDMRERMMYWDAVTYLTDDILCKVDRASMAVSLETRAPFLDRGVAELAWRLPIHMKIRGGQTKWALRQILYKYVPRELIERPKTGFSIPLAQWLRGPLRDWAENLIDERRIADQGWLEPASLRYAWSQHVEGKRDWSQKLWCVLMFQAWVERLMHE